MRFFISKQKVYDIDVETIILVDENGVTWALGSKDDPRYLEWLEEGNMAELWVPGEHNNES